jgi:hypothetical protein
MSGTKRTRIARTPIVGLITPQIVAAYRRMLELRKHAHRSPTHRTMAFDAEIAVDGMLGTKPWQISALNDDMFTLGRPFDYLCQMGRADDWHRANELRQQLQQADREMRRQERAARRTKAPSSEPEPSS